jgi:hypothetical protein
MTEPEPTPPPENPAPPPANAQAASLHTLHPALTGLAGMVVGSILLGKKAGLLAGLLGAGAKVLLEQRSKAACAPTPVPARPEPSEEPVNTLLADAQKEERLLPVSESLEILPITDELPQEELPPSGPPSESPSESPVEEISTDTAVEVTPEPPELQIPASALSVPEEIPFPTVTLPMVTAPPEPSVLPLAPATSSPQEPSLTLTADLDSTLDEALSHKDEFQNYGQHLDFPPVQASLTEAPPTDSPQAPPEPEPPAEAFVNWPESAIDPASVGQTAFQEFVANMFQEAAQASAPAAPASVPQSIEGIPATNWSATEFIEERLGAPQVLSESAPSLLDTFTVLPSHSPEPLPSSEPPELTPEDIWKLAASGNYSLEPLDTPSALELEPVAETPVNPPVTPTDFPKEEVESVHQLDSTPVQEFHSLSTVPAVLPVVETLAPAAAEPFIPPPAVPVQTQPPGMSPFVELFGAAAAQSAPLPVVTSTPFSAKRSPFLTPAEEATLSAIPVKSVESEVQNNEAGTTPTLRFSPPSASAPEPARKGGAKTLAMLTLLGALAGGGYAKREFLLAKWKEWSHSQNSVAAPPRSKSVPAPNGAVPAPAAPSVPNPPNPTAIIIPPAVAPEPAPVVTPTPSPGPVPTVGAAAVEVRPAVEPALAVPMVPDPPSPIPSGPPPTELIGQRKAEDAIRAFLGSTKVDEITASALNRERVAPAIAKYYAANPLQPMPFTDLVLDSSARTNETNTEAFLFRVRTQERPQGFPVCVEQTPEGYKIEWEAFIQCRDRAAANFWKSAAQETRSLYVILKRSHYFGEDMENVDDFDCFRINSPNPDEEPVYAFARKDSTFSRKYRNQITWDANYFAVAAFTHIKNTKGQTHQEIMDIERFNWRSGGK